MARLKREAPQLITPFQCQIAVYLLKLQPIGSTIYEKFLRSLGPVATSIAWGTLNYDILLETAAEATFGTFDYGFTGDGQRPGIIKLHGSANFRVQHNEKVRGITFVMLGEGASFTDGQLIPMGTQEAVECFADPAESFGPIMSLFMKGKPVLPSRPAIEAHSTTWFQALEKATSILVVGAAYNPSDEHIWNPILSAKARIGVVDPRGEEMVKAMAADGRPDVCHVAQAFKDAAFGRMGAFLQGI